MSKLTDFLGYFVEALGERINWEEEDMRLLLVFLRQCNVTQLSCIVLSYINFALSPIDYVLEEFRGSRERRFRPGELKTCNFYPSCTIFF